MPINFTCPHCGTTTNVADQYAGQTGPCANCGKPITVPHPPAFSPFGDMAPPPKRGMGTGMTIFIAIAVALGVLFIFGILLALLLPAVQAAREAARRMQCTNNLKQIGLAMMNYEQANGHFPPAYIADKDGKPMHSWRVLLLPYMDQQALYDQYRMNEPWNSPHNKELASRMPSVYRCPSNASDRPYTSYAMLVGPHAFSDGPTGRRQSDIKDGTAHTIMVAEAAGDGINWMEPRDIDAEKMPLAIEHHTSNAPPKEPAISSDHSNVANVVFCDGHVQSLSTNIDPKVLRALITIDGDEDVQLPND